MSSVLIVDDEPNIRRMVGALLDERGLRGARRRRRHRRGSRGRPRATPDVVLLDLMMPGELDGLGTLERLRESAPDVPVIMMSGKAGLSDAVKATKLGAFNFLEKPLSPEGVLLALASALELRRVRREARALREDLGLAGEMIGGSPAMARVRELIARVAPTDARVLVTGESGTGKELVASAIHLGSARRDRPFVRVNCAAIPRDLVESEMFGHEKGSFTGATDRRIGRFELAHTGTLFLDEVGDLGAEAQAKLLRAIEAKEIERVGGAKPIRVDVRIVSATNRDLDAGRGRGVFPRGSALPAERDPHRGAAAARASGRHARARGAFLGAAPHAHRTTRAAVDRGCAGAARAVSVAGQRARAGEHRGAARDPARRRRRGRAGRARGAAGRRRRAPRSIRCRIRRRSTARSPTRSTSTSAR